MTAQELRAVAAATSDELTGLLNRRGFLAAAGQALELCRRAASPVAMMYCDLDRFKQINDSFGHVEGDHVLKVFAGLLRSTFRSSDIVARLGGDEFVVMLTNADPATVDAAIRRMETELAAHALRAPRGYALGCSVGVVSFDGENLPDLDAMLCAADEKMYAVKKMHGRNKDSMPG
jgi:diguanylate cyclase (GGDEF)-like protein